jgi:ribulose-phosphate 3-epimerase
MSVNPGFGGQKFIQRSVTKVSLAKALLAAAGSTAEIEVDGGVDSSNAATLVRAGATMLVAGAAIFGSPDPEAATRQLRAAAGSAA